MRSSAMPGNLPEGQEFEAIFGGLPQTATPAAQHFAIALAALVAGLLLLAWSRGALRTAGVAGLLAAILLAAPQADAAERATLLCPAVIARAAQHAQAGRPADFGRPPSAQRRIGT